MNAMDEALAEIAAHFESRAAREAREAADTRLTYLKAAAVPARIDFNGMAGGMQMIAHLVSPEQAHQRRAGALLRARLHQLRHCSVGVRTELRAAASLRREEMFRRHVEASRQALATLDVTLSAIKATPMEAA